MKEVRIQLTRPSALVVNIELHFDQQLPSFGEMVVAKMTHEFIQDMEMMGIDIKKYVTYQCEGLNLKVMFEIV